MKKTVSPLKKRLQKWIKYISLPSAPIGVAVGMVLLIFSGISGGDFLLTPSTSTKFGKTIFATFKPGFYTRNTHILVEDVKSLKQETAHLLSSDEAMLMVVSQTKWHPRRDPFATLTLPPPPRVLVGANPYGPLILAKDAGASDNASTPMVSQVADISKVRLASVGPSVKDPG
jgi:hypothetical protein